MNIPMFFATIFLGAVSPSFEQVDSTLKEQLFIIIYTPGDNWDKEKAAKDQLQMGNHSRHLSQLRKDGVILIGARYSNKGMIVVKANDEQTARQILNADSAVIAKTFSAELYQYNVFYEGCVSK